MRRREFITLFVGATTWPFVVRAQQPDRMRLIGVLQGVRANDLEGKARFAAFQQEFQQFGWIVGLAPQHSQQKSQLANVFGDPDAQERFEGFGHISHS